MAFGEQWLISVMMRFTSNAGRVYAEAGAGADALSGKISKAELQMRRFNATTVAMGTHVARSFATAGAAVIAFSAVQAAQLQRTLTAIRNETGADPRKIGGVYNNIFDIANKIGVSPNEAARSWLDISRLTAGQLSVAQMRQIAPSILGFSSMIHYNRPDVSVDEATQAGLQLVHLFRAYQPRQMVPLLDQAYRLSGLMAETPSQAVRQMSYYEPLFKGLKIDNNTSVAMMALLDRAGFRQKVGTNVRALMLEALGPLQLTKYAQSGKLDMLTQMGVFRGGQFAWNKPGGGVDYIGMLNALAAWAQRSERSGVPASKVAQIIYGTLGKQGGNIGQLVADPIIIGILNDIRRYQRDPNVSLAAGIRNRDNTLAFQAGRAWGNLMAVMTELGWHYIPTLTTAFRNLANSLHNLQAWMHGHQKETNLIAGGLAAATGVSALRWFGAGAFKLLDFFGALSGLKGAEGAAMGGGEKMLRFFDNVFTAGLGRRVAPSFARFFGGLFDLIPAAGVRAIPIVGWISSVLWAIQSLPGLLLKMPSLQVAIMNWWTLNKYKIGYTIGYAFGEIGRMLEIAIKAMATAASAAGRSFLSNAYLMLTPGGGIEMGRRMDAAWTDALKQRVISNNPGFISALVAGASAGHAGAHYEPHISQTFNVVMPAGSNSTQAKLLVREAMRGITSTIRSAGNTLVNPRVPRFQSLDLASPSLGLQ